MNETQNHQPAIGGRNYNHESCAGIRVIVVKRGVDLVLARGRQKIVAELDQEEALRIGTAILYRAGIQAIRFCKDDSTDIEYMKKHPFDKIWNREE